MKIASHVSVDLLIRQLTITDEHHGKEQKGSHHELVLTDRSFVLFAHRVEEMPFSHDCQRITGSSKQSRAKI